MQRTQSAQSYAVVVLAMIYHGSSNHVFQIGNQDIWFDNELSKALHHKAGRLPGSLKHWQHANKVIIQNIFFK